MAMEYLQNIMFPQGERKYQARFHSKAPTDLANNMFNSVLNLNCEQSTKPWRYDLAENTILNLKILSEGEA